MDLDNENNPTVRYFRTRNLAEIYCVGMVNGFLFNKITDKSFLVEFDEIDISKNYKNGFRTLTSLDIEELHFDSYSDFQKETESFISDESSVFKTVNKFYLLNNKVFWGDLICDQNYNPITLLKYGIERYEEFDKTELFKELYEEYKSTDNQKEREKIIKNLLKRKNIKLKTEDVTKFSIKYPKGKENSFNALDDKNWMIFKSFIKNDLSKIISLNDEWIDNLDITYDLPNIMEDYTLENQYILEQKIKTQDNKFIVDYKIKKVLNEGLRQEDIELLIKKEDKHSWKYYELDFGILRTIAQNAYEEWSNKLDYRNKEDAYEELIDQYRDESIEIDVITEDTIISLIKKETTPAIKDFLETEQMKDLISKMMNK